MFKQDITNMLWLLQFLTLLHIWLEVDGLNNGVALTPPMGWMSWERFRCNTDCQHDPENCISERLFMTMADHLAADGYRDVGYTYVTIDDCWLAPQRDNQGRLVADPERFPSGIKALADYVHRKGLKLGIYQSMGIQTCQKLPGSWGHLETDARTFAEWGVDMVKMDTCTTESENDMIQGFIDMSNALNKTGRPIVYLCEWPRAVSDPDYSLIAKYCNTYRSFEDIQESWETMMTIVDLCIERQDALGAVSGPGSYNDPDMLIIGNFALSYDQAKTQMALWSIMAAQLLMSNDLRNIAPRFKKILLNREIIAVNQDKLGIMGKRIMEVTKRIDVWTKPLSKGSFAVVFFNRHVTIPRPTTTSLWKLGFTNQNGYNLYDLFEHRHIGHFMPNDELTVKVNPNGVVMLRGDPGNSNHDNSRLYQITNLDADLIYIFVCFPVCLSLCLFFCCCHDSRKFKRMWRKH